MTLKQLYLSVTADPQPPHTRALERAHDRESPRHRRLLKLYLKGLSDRQVATHLNVSHGSARDMLRRIIFRWFKAAHGQPRYHIVGRSPRSRPPDLAGDGLPHQTPPGGPITARGALGSRTK